MAPGGLAALHLQHIDSRNIGSTTLSKNRGVGSGRLGGLENKVEIEHCVRLFFSNFEFKMELFF